MIAGTSVHTARRTACPTCLVPMFEHCVSTDGSEMFHSHPARTEAARSALPLSPASMKALHALHIDPTLYIQPATRIALIRLRLIEAAPAAVATPGHRRGKRPLTRHPLTHAGRAAIGVTP